MGAVFVIADRFCCCFLGPAESGGRLVQRGHRPVEPASLADPGAPVQEGAVNGAARLSTSDSSARRRDGLLRSLEVQTFGWLSRLP